MKTIFKGLAIAIAFISLCACSKDINVSSTHEENSTLNLSFFESNIQEIAKSRADESTTKSLKDVFTRLDIAIFPVPDSKNKQVYRYHQTTNDENFGKLSIRIPVGRYKLVAIASKASKEIDLSDSTLATFPEKIVTDMAYVSQDINIQSSTSNATCLLKRALTKFSLQSTDKAFSDIASIKMKLTGKCNYSFNPFTGYGVDEGEKIMQKEWTGFTEKTGTVGLSFFLFIPSDKETVSVDIEVIDQKGKTIKSLHFDNVTLQQNHVTTYTGPMFTADNMTEFTFASTDLTKSDYDTTFTE